MNKLISAEIPRVLRSKILYIVLILSAFMAVASILTAFAETSDTAAIFPIASSNMVMFLSIMMPIFSGGLSIMLIAAEFSSGVIRNKFIMGHSRRSILLSWCVIYSLTTLITYMIYTGVFFLTLLVIGADLAAVDVGNVIVNILILFLFVMKFQMFSFLMVCIYPDAKTAVISYLLNNLTMVPFMLLTLSNENSKVIQFLSRIFIFGYTIDSASLLREPDKPWLTVVCIIGLSAVYLILTDLHFRKKDLK